MKKQLMMGIAAAAVVALLGTPAVATAADGATTHRFAKTSSGDVPNPFGKTNGVQPNPFTAN